MNYTKIDIDNLDRRRAIKWARETFGMPKGPNGDLTWIEMSWFQRNLEQSYGKTISRFYFKNPEDATMFALRWVHV